ncbi:BTB/POZ domain-containing protein 2-like [Oratosquilla oratoria]|uniref:BTB/POZ domain-containing protein 2-like n=1 Tax=Oratosquilla oratoria TaxID=337810 RepID=UPI003F776EB8
MQTQRSRVVAEAKSTLLRTLLVAAFLRSVASTSLPVQTSPHVAGAWQNNLTTLHERFQHIYQTGALSDLTIGFSKDNTTVSVHRLVLSVSSPVLEPMLTGPSPVGKDLILQDSPETFTKLLDHMYVGKMDLQSVEEALRVYATSYKYQVHSADKECSQYLGNQLTANNTLIIFEAAVDYDDKELQDLCVKMMNKDPDAAIAPASVIHLRKETLMGFLKSELLVSSETLMFDAALAWGRAQLSHRGEEPSSSALRKEVEELLGEVRFLAMTCEEFIDSVLPSGVLHPVEAINLLRVIRGADMSLIPEATPFSPSQYARGRNVKDLVKFDTLKCSGDSQYKWKNSPGRRGPYINKPYKFKAYTGSQPTP